MRRGQAGKLKLAAVCLYARPAKENNAAGGFDLGRYYETAEIEIWPENWPVVELFLMIRTQWRIGMSGATGLDYDALYPLLDRKGYEGDAWWRVFSDIRYLEREALHAMREE